MKLFLLVIASLALVSADIFFTTHPVDGEKFDATNDETFLQKCDVSGSITIIIHGWTESSTTQWTHDLIQNFLDARGGCVLFMDYNKMGYGALVARFAIIHKVLTQKLLQLETLGYNPDNFFLWGFSFGAHVAFEGAYNFGPKKVGRIDTCDPAGPSFTVAKKIHATEAAKNVQCVHTSTDKGTGLRYCPKDVLMGNCGITQDAATIPPKMSHGLCPYMYTSMFTNNFKLVTRMDVKAATTKLCKVAAGKKDVDVSKLEPAVAGFNMDMSLENGQYYALTSKDYPYNVL